MARIAGYAAAAMAMAGGTTAAAQLLPPLGGVIRDVGRLGNETLGTVAGTADGLIADVRALARDRIDRLRGIVRANADILEMTEQGPAVRGEIIAIDPDPSLLAAVQAIGFSLSGEERIEELGIRAVSLGVPRGMSVDRALERLRTIAPRAEFTANHLHFQSGASPLPVAASAALAQASTTGAASAIGIIDGGVAEHPALPGTAEQRGFAKGAPAPHAHATAIASLAAGSGAIRGVAPRTHLLVADIYGRDPAGGNAVALARALGWMASKRVPVVAVSLVGPSNPLVGRAVSQAQARGMQIVAAVGNDGPSAPPAFPASYPGVIAVSGVDGRNRALPEAGRAAHLDYVAPAADIAAATLGGRIGRVRGTSYAVPFVAARLALLGSVRRLDAEAKDLGARGADKTYGRGLVCGDCRTPAKK